MEATPKLTRRRLVAYFVDQARPEREQRGTGAPLEWAILHLAERWHQHPADIDPRRQRPARAKWVYWALEAFGLQHAMAPRAAGEKG